MRLHCGTRTETMVERSDLFVGIPIISHSVVLSLSPGSKIDLSRSLYLNKDDFVNQ